MKEILIITARPLHSAPRVIREIDALINDFSIHTIGASKPLQSISSYTPYTDIDLSFADKVMRKIYTKINGTEINHKLIYHSKLKKIERELIKVKPFAVITHDPFLLPYLAELKPKHNFKFVFNAHEYFPLEFDDREDWSTTFQPFYEKIYRTYLPSVDLFFNVCESIREKCIDMFGKDSIVVPNASSKHSAPVRITGEYPVRIIHHGAAISSRKIEDMIEMAALLGEHYELTLMMMPTDKNYFEELRIKADKVPNVKLIPPVSFNDIIPVLNHYDIGIFLLPPTNFNYSVALPNKFFEFIQAKLCIAIGPSPEMKRLCEKYQLGIISDDFSAESIASKIKSLTFEQINNFKKKSEEASDSLSAEHYNKLLNESVKNL